MAFYNDILLSTTVESMYKQGLPNSVPVVWNTIFTVKENGEVGDHYKTPAFYSKPVPVSELVILTLPIYDFDDDPKSPNHMNATTENCAKAQILSLPENGVLYNLLNNSIISKGFVLSCTSNYSVKYRPKFHEFSKYVEFNSFDFFDYKLV